MNRGVLDGLGRDRGFSAEPWTVSGGVDFGAPRATSVLGTSQTWPAAANTLTSWVQIVASSPFDCCAIDVAIYSGNLSGSDSSALFDIGTGPNPTETVLIDGIPVFGRNLTPVVFRVPVRVAAGTRFVWRMQAAVTTVVSTTPAVALGFIRDIPEMPAGRTVASIGTVSRATSTYTNISVAAATAQRRQTWATVGDLPATGKVIYLIPFATLSTTTAVSADTVIDWGWHEQAGLAVNTQVAAPREIWAADMVYDGNTAELMDSHNPTVWVPDGYQGGSIVAATDGGSNLLNKYMCLAVVE